MSKILILLLLPISIMASDLIEVQGFVKRLMEQGSEGRYLTITLDDKSELYLDMYDKHKRIALQYLDTDKKISVIGVRKPEANWYDTFKVKHVLSHELSVSLKGIVHVEESAPASNGLIKRIRSYLITKDKKYQILNESDNGEFTDSLRLLHGDNISLFGTKNGDFVRFDRFDGLRQIKNAKFNGELIIDQRGSYWGSGHHPYFISNDGKKYRVKYDDKNLDVFKQLSNKLNVELVYDEEKDIYRISSLKLAEKLKETRIQSKLDIILNAMALGRSFEVGNDIFQLKKYVKESSSRSLFRIESNEPTRKMVISKISKDKTRKLYQATSSIEIKDGNGYLVLNSETKRTRRVKINNQMYLNRIKLKVEINKDSHDCIYDLLKLTDGNIIFE